MNEDQGLDFKIFAPCVFSVIRSGPGFVDNHENAQRVDKLFAEQDGQCASCGLSSDGQFGLCYISGDSNDNRLENTVAVCKACEALNNGGRLNKIGYAGSLIYLPNLSQADVIRMAWSIEYSLVSGIGNEIVSTAAKMRSELKQLEKVALKYLGIEEVDDLSTAMLEMIDGEYRNRENMLGPIRWLPSVYTDQYAASRTKIKPSFLSLSDLESLGG
jgi:hypothetical protein